jgi:hypothetical protein
MLLGYSRISLIDMGLIYGRCNESVPEIAIDLRIRGWWAEPVGISKANVADIPSRHLQLVEHVGPSVKASPLPGRSSLHFDCDRTTTLNGKKPSKHQWIPTDTPPIIHFIFVLKKINPSILGYPQPYGKKNKWLIPAIYFRIVHPLTIHFGVSPAIYHMDTWNMLRYVSTIPRYPEQFRYPFIIAIWYSGI